VRSTSNQLKKPWRNSSVSTNPVIASKNFLSNSCSSSNLASDFDLVSYHCLQSSHSGLKRRCCQSSRERWSVESNCLSLEQSTNTRFTTGLLRTPLNRSLINLLVESLESKISSSPAVESTPSATKLHRILLHSNNIPTKSTSQLWVTDMRL